MKKIQIFIILGVVLGYNILAVSMESQSSQKSFSQESGINRPWNITAKSPQYVHPITVDISERKWYRISYLVSSNSSVTIDVALVSLLGNKQAIGSVTTKGSGIEEYHEQVLLVSISSAAEVHFQLSSQNQSDSQGDEEVLVSSVTISQLDINNESEVASLLPTRTGVLFSSMLNVVLQPRGIFTTSEYVGSFLANDDFVEGIDMSNILDRKNTMTGWLELRRKNCVDCREGVEVLRRARVNSRDVQTESKKRRLDVVTFPVWLRRGELYEIVFHETSEHRSGHLGGVFNYLQFHKNKSIDLITGRASDDQEGFLLRGSRIEDCGHRIQYSYHSDGSVYDYLNLWRTDGKVWFDEKERQVVGQQKKGTSFTYKFSVGGPFGSFSFSAEQRESRGQEVKLEYSLDGISWHEAPFLTDGKKGWFRFLLSGTGSQDTVYVRANYYGDNRKTGVFGLEQVSAIARLK